MFLIIMVVGICTEEFSRAIGAEFATNNLVAKTALFRVHLALKCNFHLDAQRSLE